MTTLVELLMLFPTPRWYWSFWKWFDKRWHDEWGHVDKIIKHEQACRRPIDDRIQSSPGGPRSQSE